MQTSRYEWALKLLRVAFSDQKRRRVTFMVPAAYAGSTLRYIRENACSSAGVKNCARWRVEEEQDFADQPLVARLVRQWCPDGSYPCKDCRTPQVPLAELSALLFGSRADGYGEDERPERPEPMQDERVLQYWMYGDRPMKPSMFKRMVANALNQGWLTFSQACTLFANAVDLEAAGVASKRLLRKSRGGVQPVHPSIDELDNAISAEVGLQWQAMAQKGRSALTSAVAFNEPGIKDLSDEDKAWALT